MIRPEHEYSVEGGGHKEQVAHVGGAIFAARTFSLCFRLKEGTKLAVVDRRGRKRGYVVGHLPRIIHASGWIDREDRG